MKQPGDGPDRLLQLFALRIGLAVGRVHRGEQLPQCRRHLVAHGGELAPEAPGDISFLTAAAGLPDKDRHEAGSVVGPTRRTGKGRPAPRNWSGSRRRGARSTLDAGSGGAETVFRLKI